MPTFNPTLPPVSVPPWLTGTGLNIAGGSQIYLTVTAYTVSAGGSVTAGSPLTVQGIMEHVSINLSKDTENVTPLGLVVDNEVPFGFKFSISMQEILQYAGDPANPSPGLTSNVLPWLANNYIYAYITIQRGLQQWSHWVTIGDYSEEEVRGVIRATLNFLPAGIMWNYLQVGGDVPA